MFPSATRISEIHAAHQCACLRVERHHACPRATCTAGTAINQNRAVGKRADIRHHARQSVDNLLWRAEGSVGQFGLDPNRPRSCRTVAVV